MVEKPSMNRIEIEAEMTPRRAPRGGLPSKQRSRVTNGTAMFVDGDGNSAWTRRFKDLFAAHASDAGGSDLLSEAQISLIRRCATMELQLEDWEGQMSKGLDIDMDKYGRIAGHLRRYLEVLGITRVEPMKEVKPLWQIIQEANARATATDAETTSDD